MFNLQPPTLAPHPQTHHTSLSFILNIKLKLYIIAFLSHSSLRLWLLKLGLVPICIINKPETAKLFGDNCTPKALMHRITQAKRDGEALKAALARGIDPSTIPISSGTRPTTKANGNCFQSLSQPLDFI